MEILLTGSDGFVGMHFQKMLPCLPFAQKNGKSLEIRDTRVLHDFLKSANFDSVLHLAAISFVGDSFQNPREIFEVNFIGTLNLLLALKHLGFKGRFLYVGSGDEYGLLREDQLPISEDSPLKPANPYAASKVAAEALCYQMSLNVDFEILMARPFNHIGPGQSDRFVISSFAKQIVQIKKGRQEPKILVGNIEVTRDFTDVGDVIRAYELLLRKGERSEVYNVCSGREHKIRDLLDQMLSLAKVHAEVIVDPTRLRTSEQKRALGNYQKLNRATGWAPAISMEKSLRDILDDWEERLT